MNRRLRIFAFSESGYGYGRLGLSLIEVLVVIAIVGMLLALLLPAVQAAREAGRRVECQANLKNISLALLAHHSSARSFPFGGWGHEWVGVPGRGSGKEQPGGWLYSTLPFIEEKLLHDMGNGATGSVAHKQYSLRLQTSLQVFTCPTRRSSAPWLISNSYSYVRSPKPYGIVEQVARSDYAINGGTSRIFSSPGPATLDEGDTESYWQKHSTADGFDGISHLRQGTRLTNIADGSSHTYLVGEKHVYYLNYYDGESPGDNESMYSGYCSDLHRVAGIIERLKFKKSPYVVPMRDSERGNADIPDFLRFGSAHLSGVNMAYCDGAVRLVPFDVDGEVHFRAANRKDRGAPLDTLR